MSDAPRSLRVFLCHSSGDKTAVRELYRWLLEQGMEPWLDEEKILGGQDWEAEVKKAVRNSHAVVVCVSRSSISKEGFVQKEIKLALEVADQKPEDAVFLVPARLEECQVPERLRRFQWVDLYEEHGRDKLLRTLQFRAEALSLDCPAASSFGTTSEPVATLAVARSHSPATSVLPFWVTINPPEQTVSAGASAEYSLDVPPWQASWPTPRWAVGGVPTSAMAELVCQTEPPHAALVICTDRDLGLGSYTFGVRATIGSIVQSARAVLHVAGPLEESQPGSYVGSFKTETIHVRRAGPSTLQYGPFHVLQFNPCQEPRSLRVLVHTATSQANTAMSEPPRFALYRCLTWPATDYLQLSSGAYSPNAEEVARSAGWSLEWNIESGVYVLAFTRSPFEDAAPLEEIPASVAYSIEILRQARSSAVGTRSRELG